MQGGAFNPSLTPEVGPTPSFRLFLQEELIRRCRVNPLYSLRAYAQQLKISASFLSKVLSGKRSVTPALVERLSPALGLNPDQASRFVTSTYPREARARKTQSASIITQIAKTTAPEATYQQLTLDSFQVIADWYHYAILELVTLQDFEPRMSWVAKKLGIKMHEARAAVERLQRLEMLSVSDDGKWENTSGNNSTTANAFTAAAFRKLQHQILAQAGVALEKLPMTERDQSSMTMAFDSGLLPEAKSRIKKFRRELCDYLQSQSVKNSDHVYQFSISLFPVTRALSVSINSKTNSKTNLKTDFKEEGKSK